MSVAARWSWRDVAVAGAIGMVAAVVRANALHGGLIWDDRFIVSTLTRAGGLSLRMLFQPAPNVPGLRADYYRPLELLLYGVGWRMGAKDPLAYHALVVALHAIVASALTLYATALFRRMERPIVAAWWAGLAFAVMPIHAQSVAWVVGCTDVICAGFLVGAATAGLASSDLMCATGTAAGVLGALLAKESALPALVFLPIQAALVSERPRRRRRVTLVCIACALAAILYLIVRLVSGFPISGPMPASKADSFFPGPLSLLAMIGWYAARLVIPVMPVGELFSVPGGVVPIALGVVAAVGLVVLGVYAWRRGDPVALIGGAWLVLFLAPALTPHATIEFPLAIHRLYIPSVGWVILVADWGVSAAIRLGHARALSVVAAAVLTVLAVLSWRGNTVWRDEEHFWTAMVALNPGRARPLTYLGEAYVRVGNVRAALDTFRVASEGQGTATDRARPLELNANLLLEQGDVAGACALADRALALLPDEVRVQRNAAICRAGQGVNAAAGGPATGGTAASGADATAILLDARKRLEQLVSALPNDAAIHRHLGEVLVSLGDLVSGRQHLEQAVALSPDSDDGRLAAALISRLPRR